MQDKPKRWPPDFIIKVLDWLMHQQMAGKRPTSIDVAEEFKISVLEADGLHDYLCSIGEL